MTSEEGKKTNNVVGDEEYQYPNEEYVAETTPPEEEEAVQQEKRTNIVWRMIQNNKRVTAVIVFAIVAIIAFKIMKPGGEDTQTVSKPKQKPVAQQPVQRQQPVQQTPNPAVENQLSGLKQETQTSAAAVNQLQNQVQNLRSQLSQTAASQAQLNQSMVVLVDQVKKLTAELHKKPEKKHKKAAAKAPPMTFHLKAVVPGRAWIISNDGLSESVSVGDSIPQYGKVKVVDANRGMVLTSSGKVIGYGANDH